VTQVKVPAVAFVGKKNSGKTTLLEKVIAALTERSFHVATIKHHSHEGFDFDIEGKDSWRHRQAGSMQTIIAAPDQIANVRRAPGEVDAKLLVDMMTLEAIMLNDLPSIILLEGYRHSSLPTIELFRAGNLKDEERDLGGEGNEIVAVVSSIPRITGQAEAQGIPVFSFDDIEPIVFFLIDNYIYN
jgi:molybdopterin-guanine dinucleotide biosynthesis protein MobB